MPHTDEKHFLFSIYNADDVDALVSPREGEVKLGERVQTLVDDAPLHSLADVPGRFVVLGIPEDIGVRANFGVGGAHTLWAPALKAFLNMQEGEDCSGDDVIVLGAFNFNHLMAASELMHEERMRSLVEGIDAEVAPVIEEIVRAGKIPIVVGGGHNNAFPILTGAAAAIGGPLNVINLDAHTDFRRLEGRHSGNPFRYAKETGVLAQYAMIALHKRYNGAEILAEISADDSLHGTFYEDIFLEELLTFKEAVQRAIHHTTGSKTGIELDPDSIAGVLASAATPCGITTLQARQYLRWCALGTEVAYLHLPEGAVTLADGRTDHSTAKMMAHLVSDFISTVMRRQARVPFL